MEAQWNLEILINSKVDGTMISHIPAKSYMFRQDAESALVDVETGLSKQQFATGYLSHPTYGNFFLDPTMWATILGARKWSF